MLLFIVYHLSLILFIYLFIYLFESGNKAHKTHKTADTQ